MVLRVVLGSDFIAYAACHRHGAQSRRTNQRINLLLGEQIEQFHKEDTARNGQGKSKEAADKITAPAGEGQEVAAPLEGKFFLTKNAQETPLKVGDKVKEGDLLCYIEAMKTYNAIRADFSGTVTAICVNPGDSVSEDDVLMKIG